MLTRSLPLCPDRAAVEFTGEGLLELDPPIDTATKLNSHSFGADSPGFFVFKKGRMTKFEIEEKIKDVMAKSGVSEFTTWWGPTIGILTLYTAVPLCDDTYEELRGAVPFEYVLRYIVAPEHLVPITVKVTI